MNDDGLGELIYSVYPTNDNELHIYHRMTGLDETPNEAGDEAGSKITGQITGEHVLGQTSLAQGAPKPTSWQVLLPPFTPEATQKILEIHERVEELRNQINKSENTESK